MKRFLIAIALTTLSMPAFTACSLDSDKPCTASILNSTDTSLRERYVPNHLEQIKKTDAFQPRYITPYNDALINTDSYTPTSSQSADYNSNCQFGVCLPEVNSGDINE